MKGVTSEVSVKWNIAGSIHRFKYKYKYTSL